MDELIQRICELQSHNGAFLSLVHLPNLADPIEDRNCFVTAWVLRETFGIQGYPALDEARRRALGFVMRSKFPIYDHLYSFYPQRSHPFWMGGTLYADADDTSVIGLELVRYEKRAPDTLPFIAERYLQKYRATGKLGHHLSEPWHRDGVFLTWLTTADIENPIDCCVNANVIALLAAADLKQTDGYEQACTMINEAVEWAGGSRQRLCQLTPYYPHSVEFYHALSHAVRTGASELSPALAVLEQIPWLQEAAHNHDPIPFYSNVEGDVFWTAEVILCARQLKQLSQGGSATS